MSADHRLAMELLATADAVRECVRQASNLRHAYHPAARMEDKQPFDTLRIYGDLVADGMQQIAARLAIPLED